MENNKIIELGPFRIIQIDEKMIKIYAEEYMSLYPNSGNTIIVKSEKINIL